MITAKRWEKEFKKVWEKVGPSIEKIIKENEMRKVCEQEFLQNGVCTPAYNMTFVNPMRDKILLVEMSLSHFAFVHISGLVNQSFDYIKYSS